MSPYRLDVTLTPGTLRVPTVKAQPVEPFFTSPDRSVQSLYLYNPNRMITVYGETASREIFEVRAILNNTGSRLMADSRGIALDLSALGAPISYGDVDRLANLYSEWDNNPTQPLYANEVAQQIWYIVERAIRDYYPSVENIVIVGGDDVIPFYRVPDETTLANEAEYDAQLRASPKAGYVTNSALSGSMFYRMMMTDDFYADRQPTAWRGRALYLPDLAIGRLVEQPADILAYLNSFRNSPDQNPYVIRGDRFDDEQIPLVRADPPVHTGSAMVTGYDFLSDQADQIAARLRTYGFSTVPTATHPLVVLNNNEWTSTRLADTWFSGQLDQFGENYNVQTKHQLMSLNAHFTHFDAIPAVGSTTFDAQRIYTPTLNLQGPYFRDTNHQRSIDSTSLVWSVGCHSGLSASDAAFGNARYQADFPQAVLKQGGNWIGNTGFGYGDSDLIGYSERLSDLFTLMIGRDVREPNGAYIGASLGGSLARAKREYLKSTGAGSFSVYDEKVLAQATLYGLPFIRVKVPNPVVAKSRDQIGLYDPPARKLPENAYLPPVFTRVLTFTNEFTRPAVAIGDIPDVRSTIEDSFAPGQSWIVAGIDQTLLGRPMLPVVPFDITLETGNDQRRTPRGVRLLSAQTMPALNGINPHVTTLITDTTFAAQQDDTPMTLIESWQPEVPYAQRSFRQQLPGGGVAVTDTLLVTPMQFRAVDSERGTLRRYRQMVFQVTYIDESNSGAAAWIADTTPPLISDVALEPVASTTRSEYTGLRLSARVTDSGIASASGLAATAYEPVSALFTLDGENWRRVALRPVGNDVFAAIIPRSAYDTGALAIIEARDRAGNVATYTAKGALAPSLSLVYLPLMQR